MSRRGRECLKEEGNVWKGKGMSRKGRACLEGGRECSEGTGNV